MNIDSAASSFSGVLQVITVNAIKSEHLKESWLQGFHISEVAEYLNNCLILKEPHEKFRESVRSLACFKKESVPAVMEKLKTVPHILFDLFEFHNQINIQASQLLNFLKYSVDVSGLDGESDIPLSSEESNKSSSFDIRLAGLYLEGFTESLIEYNNFLVDCINIYWDYFPQVIQDFLVARVSFETKFKDSILTCDDLPKLIESSYVDSVLALKESLDLAFKDNDVKPKIVLDLTLEKKPKFSEELHGNPSSNMNKDYTLEKMLSGVTPENQHDTIEWGKPVGAEIW